MNEQSIEVIHECSECGLYEAFDDHESFYEARTPDVNGGTGTFFAEHPASGLCDQCWEKKHAQWYVNLYRVSRHYGGAEEGGWWYDAGEPVASMPVTAYPESYLDNEVKGIVAQFERAMKITLNTTHRYSVRPDDDDYAIKIEPHMGRAFPEITPRYC